MGQPAGRTARSGGIGFVLATFTYKARDRTGGVLKDRMEAEDAAAVVEKLRARGLIVIDVSEQRIASRDLLQRFRRVKSRELVIFTRQFATMIGAGLSMSRSLQVLYEQTQSPALREAVAAVRTDVESGATLSGALARHPEVFPKVYVEMVRSGEAGGILDSVLSRLAGQLESDQELRRKVRSAMAYPTVVLVLAAVVSAAMLVFVVPVFASMFEDLGGNLPLPTRVAMALSGLLTGPLGLVVLLGIALGLYSFSRWRRTAAGRAWWDRAVLRLPLGVGEIARKVAIARSSRTLGALISTGVPILRAFEITAATAGSQPVERALLASRDSIRDGRRIHHTLQSEPVFPPMVSRMVAVGEETGDLTGMLGKVADFYESEVDAALGSLTSVIEPVMILIVGAIVGGVIVAMYLPMFRVFELIQ